MAMMRGAAHNTAKALKEAVEKAEGQLSTHGRPSDNGEAFVQLQPYEIKTRPELFQPREFSFGLRKTDPEHVRKLKRTIGAVGELDPVVVIKLGKNFVCVDGHHRLAAYTAVKWRETIRCEWFGGTLREAVAESMVRNKNERLNVSHADRLEQAWKWVVLGWGSKKTIRLRFGVSDGTVANMRRVLECWNDRNTTLGKKFRRNLGPGANLLETGWMQARLAYLGVKGRERDAESDAVNLAKRMRERLTDLLSQDANVTARALTLYDPTLPDLLKRAWRGERNVKALEDFEWVDEAGNAPEETETTDDVGLL